MDAPSIAPPGQRGRRGDPALAARLGRELEGEVLFDAFSRGRYSTDASHYQIEPIGVVVPRSPEDIVRAVAIAAEEGVPVLPRGGGTSQCGQTVGEALVVDTSKHLDRVLDFDAEARTVTVEPGLVLDILNARLRPEGLFFPVDVSTASRATLGGMAGNNSCGARSLRYGNMVHNVRAIEGLLADGSRFEFGAVPGDLEALPANNGHGGYGELIGRVRRIAEREAAEIEARLPKLLRRVGGYNLDTVSPRGHNMAQLLVGSEGTLAFFTRLTLELQPIPSHAVVGVCRFPTFYDAMESARHIVELEPAAVELVDRTMIELARDIPLYRATIERLVTGAPEALLLVEFAGEDQGQQRRRLEHLDELMATLGFPGAVVEAIEPGFQKDIWEVRKAGLNIMMSMKGQGKPVSFIEDCAVSLDDLAEYTRRLDEVFAKHGTTGTWYAHASVGCLHVRPVLNLREEAEVGKMRAIAEEAFAMVREYKGSHSGEHGDGLVRSEFHEAMFGPRIVGALEELKDAFDPGGLFNPGKIVRPTRMDDRRLFRYGPDYSPPAIDTVLDWSAWGGLSGAVEMCNNNGACRKREAGVMCPSYRVTGDEKHLTRGRANSLRLALSGQLGPDALASDEMLETLALCVSCKACRRECPTGVDLARMKLEVLARARDRRPLGPRERLFAYLPRYAPLAAALAPLANLGERVPGAAWLGERVLARRRRRRGDSPRRHLQHLFRARERPRRRPGAGRGRLSGRRGQTRRRRPAPVLWPLVPLGRVGGRGAARGAAYPRGAQAGGPAGLGDRRPRARLHAYLARRAAGPAARRGEPRPGLPGPAPRGVPGNGGRGRAPGLAPQADRRQAGAAARPLSSEGVRADGRRRARTGLDSRARGGDRRIELLRHGRRLRLRGRALRALARDGRAFALARGAGRRRR
jgi:FAD/FMN-containing dehydrogenase/ferredoxin